MAYNRDNRSGGGSRNYNDNRGGDRQMHRATCANCNKSCEVPFKPTGSKPVYCRDCFRTMGDSNSRGYNDRDSRNSSYTNRNRNSNSTSHSQPQYKEQFEALNSKLDKILKLLSQEKPKEIEVPKEISKPETKKKETKKKVVKKPKKTTTVKTAETDEVVEISVLSKDTSTE